MLLHKPPASTRALHSFPTRRSSDLARMPGPVGCELDRERDHAFFRIEARRRFGALESQDDPAIDRSESTRLNSSHVSISYAVFCLKKKTMAVVPDADLVPGQTQITV